MSSQDPRLRRVVVPTSRQGRVIQRTSSAPSPKPDWLKGALIDTAIVVGTTLGSTLLLLLISGQAGDTTSANLMARSPAPVTVLVPSPTPQASSTVQHPGPQPSASVRTPVPPPEAVETVTDDSEIQGAIDKRLQDDPSLASLNITATVNNGSVTLVGTVESDELKARIDRLVRAVKGVKRVNNQIVVVIGD